MHAKRSPAAAGRDTTQWSPSKGSLGATQNRPLIGQVEQLHGRRAGADFLYQEAFLGVETQMEGVDTKLSEILLQFLGIEAILDPPSRVKLGLLEG